MRRIGTKHIRQNQPGMRLSGAGAGAIHRWRVPVWTWLVVASALAATLALFLLDSQSFWLDEAESVYFADPLHHLTSVALASGGNFAAYYVILHEWMRFGSSDAYVRLLSAIFAVTTIPVVFALGRQLFSVRAGIFAAFVLAVNPFFIAYAQEARGYSLLLLASVVSTFYFVLCLKEPRSRRNPLAYVVASVLMVYTHLFGIFVLAAHAVTLLLLGRRSVPWRTFGFAGFFIPLMLVPLAYVAYRQGAGGLAWVPPLSGATIISFFETLAGSLPLVLLYASLAVFATIDAIRNRGDGQISSAPALTLILAWLLMPLGLTVLFSTLVTPIFVARYLIVVLPPFVLFAAHALDRIRSPAMLATVGILYVALSVQGLWHHYVREPKEDWRDAAAFIVSHAQSDDAVVCNPPWLNVPLGHAFNRTSQRGQVPLILETPLLFDKRGGLHPAAHTFFVILAAHPHVWLVLRKRAGEAQAFDKEMAAQAATIEKTLLLRRSLSVERSFIDVDVRLYTEPPARR